MESFVMGNPDSTNVQSSAIVKPHQPSRLRPVFLVLLFITLIAAGAASFLLITGSVEQPETEIALPQNNQLPTLNEAEVEINPFDEQNTAINPFEETAIDENNIFADFESETANTQDYQNPF